MVPRPVVIQPRLDIVEPSGVGEGVGDYDAGGDFDEGQEDFVGGEVASVGAGGVVGVVDVELAVGVVEVAL